MDKRNSVENDQDNGPKYVEIPRGWNRILENGSILYISPSSSRLRCRDQVIDYLKTGGTCKCGLECPLHVDNVFIFDAQVPSKFTNQNADCPKPPSSCKHCEGNAAQKEKPLQRYTTQNAVSPFVKQKNESEKDAKLMPFTAQAKGALGQKKGSARSRKGVLDVNKQQPKISIQTSLQMKKELAPPTHSICSPISNPLGSMTKSSPVQNVPTNLSTSNQGPLPSFASIVSSSKFFNPGLEAAPPIRNPMVSSGLPTTCTILSGVKASSAASSIAPSVQNSVPRIDTKSVTAASKAKPKTAQRTMSKNVSVSKNPIVSKSIPTTIIKASSVKATPQINVAVTTGAMSTNNTLLAVPSNIGSTSAVTTMTVSVSSPSHLPKAPIKRTIVSSPVSISLAASIAPRTTFSQASSLSSTRTGTTSSLSAFTTAAATKVVACSSISATTSTAAAVGSKVTPFVSQMVVESKSAKDAASPVITTSEIAATGAFTNQNADSLRSIVSKQPVNTKATAKSGIKPAARSRVAKPRTTAASKKQGLKALANAARLVSAKIPTSANSFGLPVSVGVSNPVMASYVQSSVQKTTVPPSSVIESVMTPTLWNPALMSKYGQSSQQSQSQSYVSGTWSTVLSPNISSSLPGLRHPPPSATAPTIVSTAIQSAQHRIEGQSTGVSTASTFTSTTASIARTPAPNSRPELSQLPKTSVPIQVVSTSSQQASSASTNQTQSASQGSGAHGKGQLPAAQNILNPSHVVAGANPAVVSAVPQVQPAIVAPISSNVFYQGAAVNQMYNPQSMDVNQLKALGQYQVQWPALYPGQLAANTMAVLTTGQEKGSTAPVASVNQQGYPNPFMFGIIMPTAQPGGVSATSATGSSVSSTMTSSVASTAVAAAYGSYVPIAPAATPRFSQTLAHLANAYNPYGANLRGVAPSNNQLQFTYRMMQMSAFASGGMGHNLPLGGGVGAPSPSVPDYSTLKYPLGAVKQMSYGATVSSVSTTTAHNSMARTPVSAALQTPAQTIVAAMPYVPMTTQVGSTQHPSAFNSPTTPMVATTRTSAAGGGPCTYGMMTAAANIDPKTGNTTFGYLFIPPAGDVANNTGSETNVISAPISNSCVTTAETTVTTSLNALTRNVQNQAVSQALNPKTSAICCVNPPPASPSTSSLCTGLSSASTTSSPTLWTPWSTTTTGVAIGAADSNSVTSHPPLPSKTNSTVSPMNTIFSPKITPHTTTVTDNTQSMSNRSPIPYPAGIHVVKADTKSREPPLSISPTVKTFVPCENSKSPLAEPKGQKRSYFEDVNSDKMNSSSEKRTKYDFQPSSFVETDPLLGMKRSCEAIEVYPIHGDLDKRKCSDNENCGEENSDEVNEDDGDDHTSEVTETRDGWKDSSSAVGKTADVKSDSPGRTKLPSYTDEPELRVSESEDQNGEVEEGGHGDLSELSDVGPDGNMTKLGDPTGLVEYLPAPVPQIRPHFGTGDVVWAQARGLPSWPGKIVDEAEVGKGRPDDGKRWVMWFGDHTFSQVEVDRLKTLSEGLRSLDDKGKKKKYRARKARISLEQAISEALGELENREQLKAKQAGKTKAKKKRVR